MSKHEDPSDDPAIVEAVINIKQAIRSIALIWERTRSEDLANAQADLEQAVRWLEGKEEPE